MANTDLQQRNYRQNSQQYYYSSARTNSSRTHRLEPVSPAESHQLPNYDDLKPSEEEKPFSTSLHKTSVHQSNFTKTLGNYDILPSDLRVLIEGVNYGLPDTYRVPIDDKPEWLDVEKFKLGQRFALKYLFGLTFCELLSLILTALVQDNLRTTMYSGNSSTPFTSYKRYLSTVLRINSWFEDNIWDRKSTGYKNLKQVRAMHLKVSKNINSESEKSLIVKPLKDEVLWCPLFNDLREDFTPLRSEFTCSPDSFRNPKLHMNQCDMSLVQFSFFGLMILYPEKFGAANASTEELDGLVHVWRVLGYYLGIDDRFNFCQGTIDEVKERCKNVISYWFKPSFSDMTREWEHMCRCLIEGLTYYVHGISFEVALLYLCWVLGIATPKLYSSLSPWQHIMFIVYKIIMCIVLRVPGISVLFNFLLRCALNRGQNMSPEKLKLLENKAYNFQSSKHKL